MTVSAIQTLLPQQFGDIKQGAVKALFEKCDRDPVAFSGQVTVLNRQLDDVEASMEDFLNKLNGLPVLAGSADPIKEVPEVTPEDSPSFSFLLDGQKDTPAAPAAAAPAAEGGEKTPQKTKYYFRDDKRGIDATGYLMPGERFVILKGSLFSDNELQKSFSDGNRKRRDDLIKTCISDDEGRFMLEKDVEFPSPSAAASSLIGGNSNCHRWVTEEGVKLETLAVASSKVADMGEYLRKYYPGVKMCGRQFWSRGTDFFRLAKSKGDGGQGGFLCQASDLEIASNGTGSLKIVTAAYGMIYEINASSIRTLIKDGRNSIRIKLSKPNEDGFSRIIHGNTVTNSAVHGVPLEMDMAA